MEALTNPRRGDREWGADTPEALSEGRRPHRRWTEVQRAHQSINASPYDGQFGVDVSGQEGHQAEESMDGQTG